MHHFTFQRFIKKACLLALACPPILLAYLIYTYGVNVPYWDQWALVPLLKKYIEGSLSFNDLWTQHNEHRILFPLLMMISLASHSKWNIWWELYTNLSIALFIYLLLYRLLVHTFTAESARWLFSIFLSVLVFSPIQWQNWLWGWQLSWFLNVLALLMAIHALTSLGGWFGILVACVSAVVGTYSLGSGILIWLAGALILLCRNGWSKYTVIWLAAGTLTVAYYFMDYRKPPRDLLLYEDPIFIHHPSEYAEYILRYLGSALSSSLVSEKWIGLALIILFASSVIYLSAYHRNDFMASISWVGIGAYALLAAIVTGIARAGLGTSQATSSRYTTIGILFVIATAILASKAFTVNVRNHGILLKWRKVVVAATFVLLPVLIFMTYVDGSKAFAVNHQERIEMYNCLQNFEVSSDGCLKTIYPSPEVLRERARYLAALGWAGFGKSESW